MLLFSPIVLAMSTFMAVVYGYMYLLFTTITEVFEGQYHFSQGTVGLTYLGIGVGMLAGLVVFGVASDAIVKRKSKRGEMKPEYRLPPMIPGALCVPVGLFWYGWSAERGVHWISPILGTSFVGVGMLATFVCFPFFFSFSPFSLFICLVPPFKADSNPLRQSSSLSFSISHPFHPLTLPLTKSPQMSINTYLIDAYTLHAASAMAASTVLRSLVGALLPLAGQKMYSTLGLGWGNSLLAFIALALCPIPWVFLKYGERIRKSPRFRVVL